MEFDLAETDRLLTTTRSVRRRLDRSRPVDLDLIKDCVEIALQAPTGSKFEDWRWIVVTDADQRRQIGDIYRRTSMKYLEWWRSTDPDLDESSRTVESARLLWEHLGEVPVLVFPCFQRHTWHRTNPNRQFVEASVYGSIFPAVWNFQLACHSRRLGTCLITGHLNEEAGIAEVLGLPPTVGQAGLVAVAHLVDERPMRPARRRAVDEVLHLDRWQSEVPAEEVHQHV